MQNSTLSADQADPDGLLRAALLDDQGYPVRDILLAWLLSLSPGIDPARAARTILPSDAGLPGSIGGELAEIARWPAARLAQYASMRRRRLP